MKIGWISEYSSSALHEGSKAAFVTHELLPLLSRFATIELYHEETLPELSLREQRNPSDLLFYQLEDRPENASAREAFRRFGGIAWCHDWFERGAGASADLSIRVLSAAARVSLFSSVRNLDAYRRDGGRAASYYLPYPVGAAEPFGVRFAPGSPAVAFAGSPFAEDQAHEVLAALRSAAPAAELRWLVSPQELEEASRVRGEFPEIQVRFFCGRTPENWGEALSGSSFAIHLHFSAYGDPGPLFAESLMRGVPTVVSALGEPTELESEAMIHVEPGDAQRDLLELLFSELVTPTKSRELESIGRTGRALALELFDSRSIAADLARLFESVCSGRIQDGSSASPGKI